jgi:ribosome-associated protein
MIDLEIECKFKTSRSGGKGGQNVNKVETKVELLWQPSASMLISETQKLILLERLALKLDSEGILHIVSQESRSQVENKAIALKKLHTLVEKSLIVPKIRKATKMPRAIKEAIKEEKAANSARKTTRKKPDISDFD